MKRDGKDGNDNAQNKEQQTLLQLDIGKDKMSHPGVRIQIMVIHYTTKCCIKTNGVLEVKD